LSVKLNSICIFCGSNPGADPSYVQTARKVGAVLANRNITVVYGGGRVGMMGALAEGALAAGGKVIGIIPEALRAKEMAGEGLTQLHVVDSMHERKQMMADHSDGFIALPGGFGTFEEFLETLTWAQLGLHSKPCGLLNVKHYYDQLLTFFDHAVAAQFVRVEHRRIVIEADDPERLLDAMADYQPPPVDKWLSSDAT
jgi:uncharacterized protein (TIGR00730 family)